MHNINTIKPTKYRRDIQLQDDYKNYYLGKFTMSELSNEYNLSFDRIRTIFVVIHHHFIHFLNTPKYKHLYELMHRSAYSTRNHLKDEHEKLEELLKAFDIFAANRKAEADRLMK